MALPSVLVAGGTGFVGRHLVAALVRAGYRVVVATRHRDRGRHLFLLPTVEVVEADLNDAATARRLTRGVIAAINLVGILNESRKASFADAHVAFARNLVAACKAEGVSRFLQMSACNADPGGPSRYLRSKGEAAEIVASSGLAFTIFEPSVIFGPEDRFLNLFAQLSRMLPVLAIGGANARFAPVYVDDVAQCFVRSLALDRTIGKRYPLCGPKTYTLRELVRYAGAVAQSPRPVVALSPRFARAQAFLLEHAPGQLMSRDNLLSMRQDCVCGGAFPPEFAIVPTTIESVAPSYLAPEAAISHCEVFRVRRARSAR